jgi:hypothetical protein
MLARAHREQPGLCSSTCSLVPSSSAVSGSCYTLVGNQPERRKAAMDLVYGQVMNMVSSEFTIHDPLSVAVFAVIIC